MIGRVVFVVTLGLALALVGSFALLDRLPAPASAASAPGAEQASAPEPPHGPPSTYREAVLRADARGQYETDALIDGMPVRMLIDTGASAVFVSASTAARLGLVPSGGPKVAIETANGRSTASPVRLDHVSFGGLYMNDVEALILTPEAGEVNLLGASFLRRLISVEQRNGALILRQ